MPLIASGKPLTPVRMHGVHYLPLLRILHCPLFRAFSTYYAFWLPLHGPFSSRPLASLPSFFCYTGGGGGGGHTLPF